MKFLIVDDSPAMQTIIRRSLEKAGYKDNDFRTAANGVIALDIIREWEPDLVISDWYMPEMDGIELIRALSREMLNIKVGLITTETSEQKNQEAITAGALFVVHKPFEVVELQNAILPIVQGCVEGEKLLSTYKPPRDTPGYNLQMPSLSAISKIIDGYTEIPISIVPTGPQAINYQYLPYVMGLFTEQEKGAIKAICILDLRTAAILGGSFTGAAAQEVRDIIQLKTLPKPYLDNIKRLLKMFSALFHDGGGKQDLILKSTHLIPKPFERLDKLGGSSTDKRIDLKVQADQYGEGQLIIMAVLE
jgi:CheY-like chemotaxis protein